MDHEEPTINTCEGSSLIGCPDHEGIAYIFVGLCGEDRDCVRGSGNLLWRWAINNMNAWVKPHRTRVAEIYHPETGALVLRITGSQTPVRDPFKD